ncbi:MAG: hypothetical protein OEM41_07895 [Ignavibacteria bacterium]|nr:hypothetical protein [Ignavibacteria bacterium]
MSQMEMDNQEAKSLWNSRLTWMAKHHPSALRELHRQGRLYEALSQNMTKAAMVVTRLTEKGMDPAEAERIALRDVVAPDVSGMEKEEQGPAITEREMMEIEASLLVERRKRTSPG